MSTKSKATAPPLSTQAKTLQEKTDDEIFSERNALEVEISRRAEERRKQKEKERSDLLQNQNAYLSWEIINVFAPKHDKGNCSDENPDQGWDGAEPACVRCAMLEVKNGGPWDLDAPFVFKMGFGRIS